MAKNHALLIVKAAGDIKEACMLIYTSMGISADKFVKVGMDGHIQLNHNYVHTCMCHELTLVFLTYCLLFTYCLCI